MKSAILKEIKERRESACLVEGSGWCCFKYNDNESLWDENRIKRAIQTQRTFPMLWNRHGFPESSRKSRKASVAGKAGTSKGVVKDDVTGACGGQLARTLQTAVMRWGFTLWMIKSPWRVWSREVMWSHLWEARIPVTGLCSCRGVWWWRLVPRW